MAFLFREIMYGSLSNASGKRGLRSVVWLLNLGSSILKGFGGNPL